MSHWFKIWTILSVTGKLLVTGRGLSLESCPQRLLHFRWLSISCPSLQLLHRRGVGISYTDVLKQIKRFCFDTQNSCNLVPKNISKGQPTHVTIDNSDGRQQTLTGLATTHHSNATIYVPKIQSLPDTTNCMKNETINKTLVTWNIVD